MLVRSAILIGALAIAYTGVWHEDLKAAAALPISGPRDLLRRHGVDDRCFEILRDGQPLGSDEEPTLQRILYWFRDFPPADVERWARNLDLPSLSKRPKAHRGEMFRLSGRITHVEVCRLAAETAERLEMPRYYRCDLLLADGQPAVVFARTVPKVWRGGGAIDQRADACGLFIKFVGAKQDGPPTPVFAAPRVAWHPDTLLGRLGMDVGLLDDVENRTGLTQRDRECFYQMLAAVNRTKPGQLPREADRELQQAEKPVFSLVPLFKQPDQQQGRLVAFSGTISRAIPVYVTDPEIAQRFGIDHYYQITLVTDDAQGNPVFFCTRDLPPGMPLGEGPGYAESARVAGFFFKLWGYYTELPRATFDSPSGGPPRRWLAPLLIGREVVWYPRQQPNTLAQVIGGGLVVLVILGVWMALWRFARKDRQFQERRRANAEKIFDTKMIEQAGSGDEGASDETRENHDCRGG